MFHLSLAFLIVLSTGRMPLHAAQQSFTSRSSSSSAGGSSSAISLLTPSSTSSGALSSREESQLAQIIETTKMTEAEKDMILNPYLRGAEGAQSISAKDQVDQEQLYRYFGSAAQLHQDGRYAEAIEILTYISDKTPNDAYVKNYLEKVKSEYDAEKGRWKKTSEGDVRRSRDIRMKTLLRNGVDFYKQKRYDDSLLAFTDILALDPNNAEARKYIDMLKGYFAREGRIRSIVLRSETERQGDLPGKEAAETDSAKKMLDTSEIQSIAIDKKLANYLDQVEFGMEIDDIIERKKLEDSRADLFTLGSGDRIQISVRQHPELSGSTVVRLSGEIILPLVNDVVDVQGLTADEAAGKIKNTLKIYVKDPFVTITIEEYKSKIFYVIDEIGCTPYPITRANLTLRDALFVADWGDDRALGRVIVMKPNKLHPMVKKVDAFDIIYRGDLKENIRIEDGDVIYVPLTYSAKVSKTISGVLKPFYAVKNARDMWLNMKGDVKSYEELPKIRDRYRDGVWNGESFPSTSLVTSN